METQPSTSMLKDDRLGTAQVESLDFLVPQSVYSCKHDMAQWVTVGLVSGRLVKVPRKLLVMLQNWKAVVPAMPRQGLTDVLYLGMKLGSLLPGVASCCWSTIIWDHLFWRKVIDLPTILVRKLQGAEHTHTHTTKISILVKRCCWRVLTWFCSVCRSGCVPSSFFPPPTARRELKYRQEVVHCQVGFPQGAWQNRTC